ncbi:MAG: hypothetical protein ABFE07_28870 [Armatimonadia bacterium]
MDARYKGAVKRFTVVGYFADEDQPWVEHVITLNSEQAIAVAVRKLCKLNDWNAEEEAHNIVVVEVFRGHHKGQLHNNYNLVGGKE